MSKRAHPPAQLPPPPLLLHSAHPGVAKVAFTGSVATGRRVYAAAAGNLRPATMELGGKSGERGRRGRLEGCRMLVQVRSVVP